MQQKILFYYFILFYFFENLVNSVHEQCTESKLGRVHKVHTLNLGCTHTALKPRAQCCVAACTGSCRSSPGRVAALCHARTCVVSSPPSVTIQKLYRDPNLCRAPCRSAPVPYCRALLRCIAIQKVAPSHNTKFVSRLTPSGQAMRARATARPARKSALSQGLLAVLWSCRGRVMTRCWLYHGPPVARLA